MNLLAIETATLHLSVALWCDGHVLERGERVAQGGAERLLPWVAQLLAEAGLSMKQLDAIAFGSGPGGFTGLRLACGVAQGLACGLDLPAIGIGSLDALAYEARQKIDEKATSPEIFACLDARMGEVYCATYHFADGHLKETRSPIVTTPELLPDLPEGDCLGCGDGFEVYPDLLRERLKQVKHTLPGLHPTARAVAQLAAPRLGAGQANDAAHAMPLYVRNKVALTTAERLARGGLK